MALSEQLQAARRQRAHDRLVHCIEMWKYYLGCAEQARADYETLLIQHKDKYGLNDVTGGVDFAKTYDGQRVAWERDNANMWAQTYGISILVMRELTRQPEIVPYFCPQQD